MVLCDRIANLYRFGALTKTGVINAVSSGKITVQQAADILGSSDGGVSIAKSAKLSEISAACNATITAGIDVETSTGMAHFNLSVEDQSNIGNLFNLVILGGTEFPYQADGGQCTVYTATDICAIYVAAQTLITMQITYHNLLKQYVQSLETVNDISDVGYGQDLTGDYLVQYMEKLAIAQTQMNAVITNLSVQGLINGSDS